MYYKNLIMFFLFLFASVLFGLYITVYHSTLNTTNIDIDDLNGRIEALEEANQRYESEIKHIKERIDTYELENNELKDTTVSYEKSTDKKYSDSELMLLAQLMESESGNQSFEGKLAVGTVVMNRVESNEFPDTIRDVIFQKRQFSVVSNGKIHNEPSDESLEAAKDILEGTRVLDSDVLYFYNPDLVDGNWIETRKISTVIGDHAFAI